MHGYGSQTAVFPLCQIQTVDTKWADGARHLYVVDYENRRVQKFRLLPPLASEPGTSAP